MDERFTGIFTGTGCSRRDFVGSLAAGTLGAIGAAASTGAFIGVHPAYADTVDTSDDRNSAEIIDSQVNAYAVPSVTYAKDRLADVKRVLIVVDYQVDFVSGGVFGEIEPAKAIENDLYDIIKEYQDAGDIVIYTMDTHPQDNYLQTREGQYNPPHCIPGTPGWEVYGKVAELLTPEKALMVKKPTYGSRDLPAVIQMIRDQGVAIKSIEFAGVSTTCRVLHNAIIIYNYFPEIMLIFDCNTTASYTDERTYEQLRELEGWGFVIKWNKQDKGIG